MTNQSGHISTPLLRQLAEADKLGELTARGVEGGFILVMREGAREQTLATQRGGDRLFKRLDVLATYLAQLGIHQVALDLKDWS